MSHLGVNGGWLLYDGIRMEHLPRVHKMPGNAWVEGMGRDPQRPQVHAIVYQKVGEKELNDNGWTDTARTVRL